MSLKMVVESLEDVPSEAHSFYEERDGKFQLQVDGAFSVIDRNKLQESLRKERDLHGTTSSKIKAFGDLTPEKVHELQDAHDQLAVELSAIKREGGPTGEDLDKIIEARVVARLAPVQRELGRSNEAVQALTGERDSLAQAQAKDKILREVVGAFGVKELGANPDARVDVELWATSAFEIGEDGAVVSREAPGVVPGLKPTDVFKDMKDNNQRRHWFGPTVGAGANGNSGNGPETGANPFALNPKTGKPTNLTQASAMCIADPARAKRLATSARAQDFFPSLFK